MLPSAKDDGGGYGGVFGVRVRVRVCVWRVGPVSVV